MIKYKAKNSLKSPRFAGVKTFMRMEHVVTTDDIDFAVVGIPYDTCASFRVGTRLGPAAIRDASALAAQAGDLACERYVLSHGKIQVELLRNLDQVAPAGAVVAVAFPRITGATGLPARVWAVTP